MLVLCLLGRLFGHVIAAVLFPACILLLLVIAVVAGIISNADVDLGVLLTSFSLSIIIAVAVGLCKYHRENPEQSRQDLREAVVLWIIILVTAGILGGLLALLADLVA